MWGAVWHLAQLQTRTRATGASRLRLRGCSRHPTIRQTSHQHDTISPGLERDSASEWGPTQRSALQTGGKASSHSSSGRRGLTQTCSAGLFRTRTGGGTELNMGKENDEKLLFLLQVLLSEMAILNISSHLKSTLSVTKFFFHVLHEQ